MRILASAVLFLLASIAYGQTESEIIGKANALIEEKKYDSAFKVLDEFDPENQKPDIVLLKENIVLNYFVSSIMHQMFGLKDLKKNEDIRDFRGAEGSSDLIFFEVDSILENLIRRDPSNCKLYKGLGEFYFEAHLKYGGNWLLDDNELYKKMESNFSKAVEGNCADYLSHYVLGYVNLVQEKFKESIPYFLKSIELDKDYPSSYYNVAYAYLYTDDRQNALKYAKSSLYLYTDQSYKSDAARMIGQIYTELNDDQNAQENYELADKIDPGNYYNLRSLLDVYVKTGNNKTKKIAAAFFKLAPDNPTIYNELDGIYYAHNKTNDLIDFYKSQLNEFKKNDTVLGSLHFYLGKLYIESDKKIAKEYLIKAKEIFSRLYDKDHQVFVAIEQGIRQCEQ